MKAKPTVYVLCGFIGAGKTTFAKKLEERTGAVRITKDEWLIRLIGTDPTIEGYEDYDSKICGLSRDVAFQLVEKGIDVIIDERFWEKEQRALLRRRIEETGAEEVLYYPDRNDSGEGCAKEHKSLEGLIQDQQNHAGQLSDVLAPPPVKMKVTCSPVRIGRRDYRYVGQYGLSAQDPRGLTRR